MVSISKTEPYLKKLRDILTRMDLHVTYAGILSYVMVSLIPGTGKAPWSWVYFGFFAFFTIALECMTLTRALDRPHRQDAFWLIFANQIQIIIMGGLALYVWYLRAYW